MALLLIPVRFPQGRQSAFAIQHGSPPADSTTVSHGTKPSVALDPVQGVKVLGALPREVLDVLAGERVVHAPVGAGVLGDPRGLVGAELVVGAPDVVVELAQLDAVPVQGVEVNVGAALADLGEELLQPADSVRRRGDARAAAAHAGPPQRLDAPQPLAGGEVDGHVGLVWELGLVEGEDGWRGGAAGVVGQLVDVDVVPLHWNEF